MIAELADRQHGVLARWQLAGAGVSDTVVRTRVRRGTLIALHRGVYAVGHRRLRREGFWLAAVLATGPGAVLSHRDAAGLHGVRAANHARIDVTTERPGRRGGRRVAAHRALLAPDEVRVVEAIPVTTVARTLVDLADVVPRDHVARALSEADRLGTLDVSAVEAALARRRTRPTRGYAALRAVLDEHARRGTQLTRSVLEDDFLRLLDRHGIERPATNVVVHGIEVDAVWRARRLVVELDGYAFHRSRAAFQRDRRHANALTTAGFTVLRYTHDDVAHRSADLVRELRALLAAA